MAVVALAASASAVVVVVADVTDVVFVVTRDSISILDLLFFYLFFPIGVLADNPNWLALLCATLEKKNCTVSSSYLVYPSCFFFFSFFFLLLFLWQDFLLWVFWLAVS